MKMLQNEGITSLVTTIANQMEKGQFGSNSDAVTAADGGVKTAIAATLLDLDSVTVSGRNISAKHVVNSVTANGNTFAENEIRLSDTNSITRNIFTSFAKTSSIEVNAFTIFTIVPKN